MDEWRNRLIETPAQIRSLLESARRIAVLGIKTEAQADQPAFYVAQFLQNAGIEVVPVPVYYPRATEILGKPVYRKLADVPGEVDIVDVFRRSADVAPHLDDMLAKRPKAVWMQSGIRNEAVAEALARAGIAVVQDRCIMVELRRVRSG
ncbi:MAG TPA: CoA-binding protein [Candidatus Saccharimonadia bacterium]|nr:CoA-binding protein [Candidatus Saccharimonadia bacterium]